jgi:predicted RNA-binding protein with PIN domain
VRELLLVDGFNVLHAGVLRGRDRAGWWRPPAQARLLAALAPLAGGDADVRVVFDGRPPDPADGPAPDGGEIEVVHAPSADDRIAEEAAREAPRRPVTVATSDRELAARARAAGARVVGARALLERARGG